MIHSLLTPFDHNIFRFFDEWRWKIVWFNCPSWSNMVKDGGANNGYTVLAKRIPGIFAFSPKVFRAALCFRTREDIPTGKCCNIACWHAKLAKGMLNITGMVWTWLRSACKFQDVWICFERFFSQVFAALSRLIEPIKASFMKLYVCGGCQRSTSLVRGEDISSFLISKLDESSMALWNKPTFISSLTRCEWLWLWDGGRKYDSAPWKHE